MAVGMSILPIKSKIKGSAPSAPEDGEDIIDEALLFFRANVLFASFDFQGGADRVLAYLTLYIQHCLCRLDAKGKTKADGTKVVFELAKEAFPLPQEPQWPFGGHFPAAKTRAEADLARAYIKHLREEAGTRLLEMVYNADGTPNKFWMAYSKKKFMNIPTNN
ncbi:hypothetical protein BASA81_015405 [Batrachochytrium salamandrivorans]|nr:hypothetical protein BASA81_015405 [Batrachochytrium salamandrivorans]